MEPLDRREDEGPSHLRKTHMPFVSFVSAETGYDIARQALAVLCFEVDDHDPFVDLLEKRPVIQVALDPHDIPEMIRALEKLLSE